MNNKEKLNQLEIKLHKIITKRRIIEGVLSLVFTILWVTCYFLRENSKVVTTIGEIFTYRQVTYNNNYIIGVVIGLMFGMLALVLFLTDLIMCRFASTEANGHYITVYRGLIYSILYINGEEVGRLGGFIWNNVIEATLPDGVKVTTSIQRAFFCLAHISYSDHNQSVDI